MSYKSSMICVTKKDLKKNSQHLFKEKEIRRFHDLNIDQRNSLIKQRVKDYSQKVHRKIIIETEEDKSDVICQRENGFYVDTVRSFRDRRYVYKGLTKKWFRTFKQAKCKISFFVSICHSLCGQCL